MYDEGIGAEFAPHGPGSALVASFSLSPDDTRWQGVAPTGSPVRLSMENAVCCVSNACP